MSDQASDPIRIEFVLADNLRHAFPNADENDIVKMAAEFADTAGQEAEMGSVSRPEALRMAGRILEALGGGDTPIRRQTQVSDSGPHGEEPATVTDPIRQGVVTAENEVTEQLLEQAVGEVAAACRATLELAETDRTGQLFITASQCLDVQNLLQDAGAIIDVDMVDRVDTRTPHELLRLAAAALDAIPADQRPTLLAPARAELQATMIALADTSPA